MDVCAFCFCFCEFPCPCKSAQTMPTSRLTRTSPCGTTGTHRWDWANAIFQPDVVHTFWTILCILCSTGSHVCRLFLFHAKSKCLGRNHIRIFDTLARNAHCSRGIWELRSIVRRAKGVNVRKQLLVCVRARAVYLWHHLQRISNSNMSKALTSITDQSQSQSQSYKQ